MWLISPLNRFEHSWSSALLVAVGADDEIHARSMPSGWLQKRLVPCLL